MTIKEREEAIKKILQYWDCDDGVIDVMNGGVAYSPPLPSKRHEMAMAKIRELIYANPCQEPQANIAEEACRLVLGDRNESYGDPKDDYDGTAKVWSGLLIGKLKPGVEITAREAIIMMAALKLRREVTRPKRDNRVDAIGYGLCLDWVETGIKPKPLSETK